MFAAAISRTAPTVSPALRAPYNYPITVFDGNQDSDVNKDHLAGWRNFTTG
ncbi:MAG: hypothetical protein AB1489_07345 [Acidobacteriota bacterium]